MADNPYQPPQSPPHGSGGADIEFVRKVARYQRGILLCILTQLLAIGLQVALTVGLEPERLAELQLLFLALQLLLVFVGIASMVFVFMLAATVYNTVAGVALGILAVIPCVGLIVLLVVNGKATAILRQNGIRVGLLGADSSQI
jgi:hypothetical protein